MNQFELKSYSSNPSTSSPRENEGYNSEEDNNAFQGIAKNLLNIRNGSRWETETKEDVSVVKCFEPKFLQVFAQYCESIKQTVHTSNHLMSVCLENLIPFCCWARESSNRVAWIKEVMDDNLDLRPEVRNGLAMILIYTFATAKAHEKPNSDMFLAIQDAESGLGIVNKTSLKIYNDPYFYFMFLKSCMSGLIDAGKVPENERQNQPKKAKRQSDNKEELVAFLQMKNVLVSMFNRGESALVRAKVQQISNVWQERHKSIRNNWFTTALVVISAPNSLKQRQAGIGSGILPTAHFRESAYNQLPPFPQTAPQTAPETGTSKASSSQILVTTEGSSGATGNLAVGTVPVSGKIAPTSTSLATPGTVSSASLTPLVISAHPSQTGSVPYYSESDPSHAKQMRSILSNGPFGARLFPSIPAIRFERVGGKEWECKESKIYNIESLVLHNNSVFCLVDEAKLTTEERVQKKVFSQSSGFVSLQAELQQRGALVTSWPKTDHNHMLDFLESWMAQASELSLTDFWRFHSITERGSGESATELRGSGVIAYEMVMQVGVVIRKNEALGIAEDCWRLIYPRDLHTESMSITLGAFLSSFFPQLRSVLAKLNGGLGAVVVKYFPHKIEPPVTQAPKMEPVTAYQTIGTLDEPCVSILSRFDTNNLCFHDLVLQMT